MLDALGLKGIWRGQDGHYDMSALDTLAGVEETAAGMIRYVTQALIPHILRSDIWNYGDVLPEVQHLAFSDTIVVTATMPRCERGKEEQRHLDSILVDIACQCAAYVLRESPKKDRPLVYRGVVTCGDLKVRTPHFLGPAMRPPSGTNRPTERSCGWRRALRQRPDTTVRTVRMSGRAWLSATQSR